MSDVIEKEEALKAFGGDEAAKDQAENDVEPSYYIEEVEE